GMGTVSGDADVLVVTERGYGKRTPVAEYPMHHRAGQGVFTLKVTDRVGKLAAMRVVHDPEEEVLIISASGMVLRTPVGAISQIGRQTQGVIVMRLTPEDPGVVAIAPVGAIEEGEGKERAAQVPCCSFSARPRSWWKGRWPRPGASGWSGRAGLWRRRSSAN